MNDGSNSVIQDLIRKYSLANAIKFEGKADAKAVIGKLLAERPDLRSQAREIIEKVNHIVNTINQMSISDQISELEVLAPELLEKTRERRVKELPPLKEAKKGQVITRLPPEPSGYPHIGHAYAGYINWYYAREYDGQIILRFEDTNPRNVHTEYYEAFRKGYRWMKLDWDDELNVSDDVPYFYEHAEKLLDRGELYFCSCSADVISENRRTGKSCDHRQTKKKETRDIWKAILDGQYSEGEIVCRLRIDMTHPNAVMRDPNIFRIIDFPHPIQGDKYRLWPTYDFANALEDHRNKISHILRSNEFASRGELQNYIRDLFQYPQPFIQEWSRFAIEGSPVSKRKIRPLIETNVISGWDDIRLTTLPALRRRGIIPEAIKEMTREVGLSVAQPILDWSVLLGINRKLVDPLANRYYCVTQPMPVDIIDAKPFTAELPYHPDFKERGTRQAAIRKRVFIDGTDAQQLRKNDVFRLKHAFNLRVDHKTKTALECSFAGDAVDQAEMKVQWVTPSSIPVKIFIPDVLFKNGDVNPKSLQIFEGLGEKALQTVKTGTIIQLERKGFGFVEKIGEKVNINMTE
ncbi:MAG: glutamate--tRNA ligase [Candidatus Thorarchaeota archaeon]